MKKQAIKRYILLFCLAIGWTTGCITPYEPEIEWKHLLVVEGCIIAPYGTYVRITDNNQFSSSYVPSQAEVTLITDQGDQVATARPHAGKYVVMDSIAFQAGTKYAIHIRMNGKEYQSDFVEPQITPEIDEVNFQYKEQEAVNIRVSTHNDVPNASRYYRWTYREDWEIVSEYFAQYVWDFTNGIRRTSLDSPDNTHHCWASETSRRLLLGKSDQYKENRIKDHTLLSLGPLNSRFSYLYSIQVKQQALDKKAFEYFENVRKNVEQTGGLFAPQPTEIRGNIRCFSHPEEVVIGYIYATTETSYRLYIKAEEVPGMSDIYDCGTKKVFLADNLGNAFGQGMAILSDGESRGTYVCINRRCVDCTARGGTKNKPDFWPNNHQ